MEQANGNLSCSEGDDGDFGASGVELPLLEKASQNSGRSIDFWEELTDGMDENSLALLAARAHMISSELFASCGSLRGDQNEVVALFSHAGERDRKTFLKALRSLVELRKGRLN